MTHYSMDPIRGVLKPWTDGENPPILTILKTEEFRNISVERPYRKELLHSLGSIRYCKAEPACGYITGTLRMPRKGPERAPQFTAGFVLSRDTLVLIEDSGDTRGLIEKRLAMYSGVAGADQLLLCLMEQMIGEDALYLSHIEGEAEKLEDRILQNDVGDLFPVLTTHRRKLSELNTYYNQLSSMGEQLASRQCAELIREPEEWMRFARRAERLQSHARLLSENMIQLRELYQSGQDAIQNRIIGVLTVVTTFFLPLTLLTGWYGMNFVHMPELRWQYGYPAVIAVAAVIAIAEFLYFKKKKFF